MFENFLIYWIIFVSIVDKYQVGQLYTVAEFSKQETGGSNGIEVVINEPFNENTYPPPTQLLDGSYKTGQYTQKNYYLKDKVPGFVKALVSESYLTVEEIAWNAYPYCRTVIHNRGLGMEKFLLTIESMHHEKLDLPNPHNLSKEALAKLKVVTIDISDADYAQLLPDVDQKDIEKLQKNWWANNWDGDIMCAYKLVTIHINMWFVGKVGEYIMSAEEKLFADFHKKLYGYKKRWEDMNMEDIRKYEEKTKEELAKQIKSGTVRGTVN